MKKGIIVCIAGILLLCNFVYAQDNLPDPEGLKGTHPGDCQRATPEDIIVKGFEQSRFKLAKDSITGYNWVDFKNGDKLLIINTGCGDFTLVFEFTTARYKGDTANSKYWYPIAHDLMSEIAPGLAKELPFDVKKGIDTLASFTQHYPDSLTYKHSIIYNYDKNPPEDTKSDADAYASYMAMFPHIFLNRVQKLNDGKYMVEVYVTIALGE